MNKIQGLMVLGRSLDGKVQGHKKGKFRDGLGHTPNPKQFLVGINEDQGQR